MTRRGRQRTVDRAVKAAAAHLPPDGDLQGLLASLSEARGRPLVLVRRELAPGGPSGAWLALPDKDYIVVTADAAPSREAAIICHEIGHIVLGHTGTPLPADASAIAPAVAPHIAARFLGRHGYAADQERDAESFGTLLAVEHARLLARPTDMVSGRLC